MRGLAWFFGGAETKNAKTTPCTVEGPLIDKGFSNRVTTTFAAAMTLTRRAKHWQNAIVAEIANASVVAAGNSSELTYEV
jgi:hypothetical protein